MKKRLTIDLPETITAPGRFESLVRRGDTLTVEPQPLSWSDVTVTRKDGELYLELCPHGIVGVVIAKLRPLEAA